MRATNSNDNNSINQRPPQQRSLINSLFVNSNVKIAKCYLFNAQSIVNKLSELHHVMYIDKCDRIFITETWLSTHITDGLLDPQSLFTTIRSDRHHCRGEVFALLFEIVTI